MTVEEAIVVGLAEKKSIIIPSFGSIIKSGPEGSETIIFNQFLTYNDKKLTEILCQNNNLNEEEALSLIAEYVATIKESLENNRVHSISGLGSFKMLGTVIQFKGEKAQNAVEEKPLPEPIETQADQLPQDEYEDLIENQEEVVEEEIDTFEEAQAEAVASTIIEEQTAHKEYIEVEEDFAPKEPIEPKKPIVKEPEKVETPLPESASKMNENPVPTPMPAPKKEKKKRKKGLLWIGLICLIGGFSLLSYLKWPEISNYLGLNAESAEEFKEEINEEIESIENFKDKFASLDGAEATESETYVPTEISEETEQETNETISTEQVLEPVDDPEPENEVVPEPIETNSKLYHVVGGSFGSIDNANAFVDQLKSKGYDAVNLGKRGKLYTVSYGGSSTKDEAKGLLEKVKEAEKDAGSCWILHF